MAVQPHDAAHIERLRTAYIRRLQVRQVQLAELGIEAGPEILIEIEDIQERLRELDDMISADTPQRDSEEVKQLLRRYDSLDLIRATVAGALQRLTELEIIVKGDREERGERQRRLDVWLGFITMLLVGLLLHAWGAF